MAKYNVYIHYEGCMTYTVNANSEEEAEEKARIFFDKEEDKTLIYNLADSNADIEKVEG